MLEGWIRWPLSVMFARCQISNSTVAPTALRLQNKIKKKPFSNQFPPQIDSVPNHHPKHESSWKQSLTSRR